MDQKCLICVFYGWNFKKLLSDLKLAPSNLSDCKVSPKAKMSKYGTKNALFGYFWARILKYYCHIWNQHPQICQKWAPNSYSEFWYRVRFFQSSLVHFSEDRVRVRIRFVKYALWSYLWSSDLTFSLICYQWFILKFLLYVPYDYIRCNDSEILLILLCP